MAQTKKPKIERRSRADIAALSVEAVQVELVAAGIRPIEFVTVDDTEFLLHTMPKLEPHQRLNWMEYATRSSDPFVADHFSRTPQDDLRTMWRKQLYEHELQTYVNGLSRAQLAAQLKSITVDAHFDKTPTPSWTVQEFGTELAARLRELEQAAPNKRKKSNP